MNADNNVIHLPKPDIFSFSECLHFLDRGYDDCLYSVKENRVIKPLRIDNCRSIIEVKETADLLQISILKGTFSKNSLKKAADFVKEWFDLERDLGPFYRCLNKHSQLSWMTHQFRGLRLMGIPDLFEALCWCVIGQQINLTFAYRLKRRLVETYGSSIEYESKRHYYFPAPERLADLTVDELKDLQFSRQKAEYITGIARKFASGEIDKERLSAYDSDKQMLKQLRKIRGVGEWTANYVLMKSLKKMNCITYGDTGLQAAVSSVLGLDRKPSREEINSLFAPFEDWQSYLVIYLWRTLS
ncbi:MAG: DNA-3-methyladenine glycosylase [Balneolaceae bacterium]|jgi:DNA-3-methyladenine glycosylase II